MIGMSNFDQDNNSFYAKKIGRMVILRFKGNPLLNAVVFKSRDLVLDYFDLLTESNSIKVVVLMNQSKESVRDAYSEFYKMIFSSRHWEHSLLKMYQTFDQVILKILGSNKFFISANHGHIIPQIFNVSLACDYRIIANDTVFDNAPLELGLLPRGGGVYFLNRLLGPAKTFDLLLSDKKVRADKARSLGLVNQVVPFSDLDTEARTIAEYYLKKPAGALSGIKKLINYSAEDLRQYLKFENEQFLKSIGLN